MAVGKGNEWNGELKVYHVPMQWVMVIDRVWCVENQEVVDDISSLVWYVWYSRVHTIWYGMVRI